MTYRKAQLSKLIFSKSKKVKHFLEVLQLCHLKVHLIPLRI